MKQQIPKEPAGVAFEGCRARVLGVFAGGLTVVGETGHLTGMCKKRRHGPVQVGSDGLADDQIADLRFHGGPDKAVHLYPIEHYAQLRAVFSAPDEPLGPAPSARTCHWLVCWMVRSASAMCTPSARWRCS